MIKVLKSIVLNLIFLALLISITTVSCSNKEAYNYLQNISQDNCKKLPAVQYDDCVKNNSISHKEYEKERKKLIN